MSLESDIQQLNVWAASFNGYILPDEKANTIEFTFPFHRPPGDIASYPPVTRDAEGVRRIRAYLLECCKAKHVVVEGLWSHADEQALQKSRLSTLKFEKLHS